MEDEGVVSFDFEGGLDTAIVSAPANPNPSSVNSLIPSDPFANPSAAAHAQPAFGSVNGDPMSAGGDGGNHRHSFRQTVCRHWLRSLCMKGDACGFLHQYDKARMPVCRFFRMYDECREQDCVYKHTNEDIKECNMPI